MTPRIETNADIAVRECIDNHINFALIAGAGSGKTTSLIDALKRVREREGEHLRQNGQRVACITYTKRAVEVIKARLGFDDLYSVSTLHSFLWSQIGHFHSDIREALRLSHLPTLIAKARERGATGNSRDARKARAKAERLQEDITKLDAVERFTYAETPVADYSEGILSHDDIIDVSAYLFLENATFRKIIGACFPYIFIDEAQDTFEGIVDGINLTCMGDGLPIVGYFGDPWQQIYDNSSKPFSPPAPGKTIPKTENFRCSQSVIKLLNAFRNDVEQYAAGDNQACEGSVIFRLVQADKPEGERKRYTEKQIDRALEKMDAALTGWGWADDKEVIRLFLARQMIARRMGFSELNKLFTGTYASSRAQEAYEHGEHFLLTPLTSTIYPLIAAHTNGDERRIIEILTSAAPAFKEDGPLANTPLKQAIGIAKSTLIQINDLWNTDTIKNILEFCVKGQIIEPSEKLRAHLERAPRMETYDQDQHELDKGDWLADHFFSMRTIEIPNYAEFISENTPYSTQHGVKGEEYHKVLVVYDDTEASWNNYNFCKLLTPATSGAPTDGQLERGRKLAYVSFSRAREDLRVLLFTPKPEEASQELIDSGLLEQSQIETA